MINHLMFLNNMHSYGQAALILHNKTFPFRFRFKYQCKVIYYTQLHMYFNISKIERLNVSYTIQISFLPHSADVSSELSPQSSMPLHNLYFETHAPFLHVNWFFSQAESVIFSLIRIKMY